MRKAFIVFLLSLLLPFAANADDCPVGTYMLDSNIRPTGFGSSGETWQVLASYGYVYGISLCNSTPGYPSGTATDTDFPTTGASGYYCWCKMTNPAQSSWVFYYDIANCSNNCSHYCASSVQANPTFRENMFNSIGCQACTGLPSNAHWTSNGTFIDNCSWECDAGYYKNGDTCSQCTGATYSDAGATSCTECPAVSGTLASRATGAYNYYPSEHNVGVSGCYAYFWDSDDAGSFITLCYYNTTDAAYGGTNSPCQIYTPSSCASGKYNTIASTSQWLSHAGYASCKGVDCMKGRVCTDVGVGYYSPDGDTQRYVCENKPANSHFACSGTTNTREWECDTGYGQTSNNTCEQLCTAGVTGLHTSTGLVFNLYANRQTQPSIYIQPDDSNTVCYVNLAPGVANNAVNVEFNGAIYHSID